MKAIKMFGLVAIAALLVMAFVGASSAMAESTALCKEDAVLLAGEVCPEAQRISHVHERTLPENPGLLLTTIVNIECQVLFLGDVTSEKNLGNPLEILGHFTYPEDTVNHHCRTISGTPTKCEVKELSKHAIIKVLKLGHELADITGEAEVNAHCGGLINCTYNGVGLSGHGLGPLLASEENGETRLEEQTTNKTGGLFCPKTAKLDLLTTPWLSTEDIELAEAMGEPFRSGPTYIAK